MTLTKLTTLRFRTALKLGVLMSTARVSAAKFTSIDAPEAVELSIVFSRPASAIIVSTLSKVSVPNTPLSILPVGSRVIAAPKPV